MCNEGVMLDDGVCSKSNSCADENCRYCSFFGGSEKCLVCKTDYAIVIEKNEFKCKKEKETTKNCWVLTASNIEQCAICKIDYYYKEGNCTKSDEYIVFMNAGLPQWISMLLVALVWIR